MRGLTTEHASLLYVAKHTYNTKLQGSYERITPTTLLLKSEGVAFILRMSP